MLHIILAVKKQTMKSVFFVVLSVFFFYFIFCILGQWCPVQASSGYDWEGQKRRSYPSLWWWESWEGRLFCTTYCFFKRHWWHDDCSRRGNVWLILGYLYSTKSVEIYILEARIRRATSLWPCSFQFQIFGPVQSILKFKDIDEVITRANDTSFGLGSGVLTNDINKAMKVVNGIEAGTVW